MDVRCVARPGAASRAIFRRAIARGLAVPDSVSGAIAACDDVRALDRWIERAVTAASAADALG